MNAAARLVHQHVLIRHLVYAHFMTKQQLGMMLLVLSVLVSALSVVYVTHLNRTLYADYEHNIIEQNHLTVQRGQLLLERSTWMMQSRIEQIAEKQLGMVVPDHNKTVMIHQRFPLSSRDGVFLEGRIAILPSKCKHKLSLWAAYKQGRGARASQREPLMIHE